MSSGFWGKKARISGSHCGCVKWPDAKKAMPQQSIWNWSVSSGEQVRQLIASGTVSAVHDVSDGGLLVALTEMALAGKKGCTLSAMMNTVQAFGEDQGRYVLTSAPGVVVPNAVAIGLVGGTKVVEVELADLRAAHDSFFKEWMEQ